MSLVSFCWYVFPVVLVLRIEGSQQAIDSRFLIILKITAAAMQHLLPPSGSSNESVSCCSLDQDHVCRRVCAGRESDVASGSGSAAKIKLSAVQ
ncbi:hypothetical protein COO60DRAFT_96207 [Scenedesmus sp. NREL 46B-D3]|nr:hypothetical protein COO60DRAFT_96207 [Scenedesmus sp. NREL 46B-D3]